MSDEFEVVGVYPIYGVRGKFLSFSGHIYLIDKEMDVRGFRVLISADGKHKVNEPTQIEYDHEEKKNVRFPIVKTGQDWWEKAKNALLEEAKKETKGFKWPKKFPKSYFNYLEFKRKGGVA